jgi:trehalose-6-phosphatase
VFPARSNRLAARTKRLVVARFRWHVVSCCGFSIQSIHSPVNLEILGQLSLPQRIAFTVISGWALDDLVRRVPLPIILAGNYGLAIRGPALSFEHPGARKIMPQLAEACCHLKQVVAAWKGAWVEHKMLTAAVHYRDADWSEHYALMRSVCHCWLRTLWCSGCTRVGKRSRSSRASGGQGFLPRLGQAQVEHGTRRVHLYWRRSGGSMFVCECQPAEY